MILVGIVSLAGSLGVSAVTAPSTEVGLAVDTTSERGQTLVGMQAEGRITMFDSNGDTVWRIGSENVDYFDVTMMKNGSVLAAFVSEGEYSCGQYEPPCSRTGFQLINPKPKPGVVGEWSFPIREKLNREVHDAEPLPSGEFLLTDMDHERIFTVAPTGKITWQWNASKHYDAPDDPTRTDWLHINDVDQVSPGRYMVSVRNANQLLIIKRGQGVVDVINEDESRDNDANCRRNNGLADYSNDSNGDIRCGDPEIMDHQHNPQYLGPSTILVADSENERVVELHEDSGEWKVAWGVDSANGVSFNWPRDADRLPNGHTLITDSRNDRIIEVTPNGTTVWSIKTGKWPYDTERLPYGELRGSDQLPQMNAIGEAPSRSKESTIPLLEQAYAGLSYLVSLPFWFQPWHIGVVALAVPLLCLGGVLVWSGHRNHT